MGKRKCNVSLIFSLNFEFKVNFVTSLLQTANFTIEMAGWDDHDAGLNSSLVELYVLSWHDEGYLVENQQPIFSGVYNFFENISTLQFDLPSSGMYSIIARVMDLAGNAAYARALILYDDQSSIETTESGVVVEGAFPDGSDHWFNTTDPGIPIRISWTGRYTNRFQVENHLLSTVRPFNQRYPTYDEQYIIDDVIGNRTYEEYPSDGGGGVVEYRFVWREGFTSREDLRRKRAVDEPEDGDWETLTPLSDNVEFTVAQRNDGDSRTFWLRPSDVIGNTMSDYINVRTDSTPPVLGNPAVLAFTPNVEYNGSQYYSR